MAQEIDVNSRHWHYKLTVGGLIKIHRGGDSQRLFLEVYQLQGYQAFFGNVSCDGNVITLKRGAVVRVVTRRRQYVIIFQCRGISLQSVQQRKYDESFYKKILAWHNDRGKSRHSTKRKSRKLIAQKIAA